jgi:hypothetical protein
VNTAVIFRPSFAGSTAYFRHPNYNNCKPIPEAIGVTGSRFESPRS